MTGILLQKQARATVKMLWRNAGRTLAARAPFKRGTTAEGRESVIAITAVREGNEPRSRGLSRARQYSALYFVFFGDAVAAVSFTTPWLRKR